MYYLKITIFQMTFKRPGNNRVLTFTEIANETRLPENEVCKSYFILNLLFVWYCIFKHIGTFMLARCKCRQ